MVRDTFISFPLRSFLSVFAPLSTVFMMFSCQKLQVLCLICLLPLLVIRFSGAGSFEGGNETVLHPLTLLPLFGTLETCQFHGIEHFIPRLSVLLKGICFRKLRCSWESEEDIRRAITCVNACSNTLEYVDVCSLIHGTSPSASLVLLAPSSNLRLNQGTHL